MSEAYSIFKSEAGRSAFLDTYDRAMGLWQFPYETFKINTDYGICHITACGPRDGKPLLLFHGMTGNSSMWYPVVSSLQAFRTYCIDAPGDFGKSIVKRRIKTSADAQKWIEQVYTTLSLETASLIGHSMGGWLSANFALGRPEMVDRLILIAPVATFLPMPLFKLMHTIYPAMLLPSPKRIARAWSIFCSKGYSLPAEIMDMVITAYTHCRLQLQVMPRVFPKESWKALHAPVLFLVGEDEQIYAADRVCRRVAKMLPHAKITVVPKAGHCLTIEQSELVNNEIKKMWI